MNRQRQLLAALVALLAMSLIYSFWAMPRQEKAPPRTSPAPAPKTAKPAAPVKGTKAGGGGNDRLLLDLLHQEPRPFPGAGRDIFRFAGAPAVVDIEPVEVVPPPPPPPKPPPTPDEILRGAVTDVTFLGFLEKRGIRTVFLTSGEEVYLVKAGERFGKNKELIAKEITAKQLVVGWVDGPETVTVQLLENEKLQPATIGGAPPARGSAASPFGTVSPRPAGLAPRRLLTPQRTAAEPPPEVPAAPETPPDVPPFESGGQPTENISQEEPLQQGLPSGE